MTEGRVLTPAASANLAAVHAGRPAAAAAIVHTLRNSRRLTPRPSRRFNRELCSSSFSIVPYLLL
jgi:hypothetical protein